MIGKNLTALALAGGALVFSQPSSHAETYSQDFSTNPGWTTDQPNNFFWDETSGTYFVSMTNKAEPQTPNRYAFTQIDWNGESFRLDWDFKCTRSDWSAGINFGLFDDSLNYAHFSPSTLNVEYTHADAGRYFTIFAASQGNWSTPNSWAQFPLETWLHNDLRYDSSNGLITYQVVNRNNGETLVDTNLTYNGEFSKGMDFLGFSRYPMGQGGGWGYDPNGIASGYIDNIVFSNLPEPSALTLIAAGTLATSRRRK